MEKITNVQQFQWIQSKEDLTSNKTEKYQSGTSQTFDAPKIVAAESRIPELIEKFGEKALKEMGIVECATCSSRTYVDGSSDPGVSFKTPTRVSAEASFGAVMSHEQEHVSNEKASAQANSREIVSQSVQVFMSVCPECGKAYASGGVTKTTTASKSNYKGNQERMLGNLVDAKV